MGSVTVKSPTTTQQSPSFDDVILVKLSREIAMDISDLDAILDRHGVSTDEFELIKANSRFAQLLQNAIEEWHSALNTHERVRVKSATMIELWLEHANELLHKPNESTTGKTELAKFLARLSDMGVTNANVTGAGGERFSVTINLGADAKLTFEKEVTAKVIDHEPPPTQEQ